MKIQELFDLLAASQDFISIFDGVETTSQLVSRLERLKREDVEGILQDLNTLRLATGTALEANLELGGSLGDEDDEPSDLEEALDAFPEYATDDETEGEQTKNETPATPSVAPKKENSTS